MFVCILDCAYTYQAHACPLNTFIPIPVYFIIMCCMLYKYYSYRFLKLSTVQIVDLTTDSQDLTGVTQLTLAPPRRTSSV